MNALWTYAEQTQSARWVQDLVAFNLMYFFLNGHTLNQYENKNDHHDKFIVDEIYTEFIVDW